MYLCKFFQKLQTNSQAKRKTREKQDRKREKETKSSPSKGKKLGKTTVLFVDVQIVLGSDQVEVSNNIEYSCPATDIWHNPITFAQRVPSVRSVFIQDYI